MISISGFLSKRFLKPVLIPNFNNLKHCKTESIKSEKLSKWQTAKPFSEIPSLPMLPVFGTAWHYMPIIGKYDLNRQHLANQDKRLLLGDVIREKIGTLNFVISFRAEDLEEIFRNEGIYPNRTEFSSLKAYRESRKKWFSTSGLLAINGSEWHELRSKTQKHLLRPKAAISYLDDMQDIAKDFVNRIKLKKNSDDEVPDLMNEIYKWALESIGFVGLDTRLGCLDSDLSPNSDAVKMINSVLTQFECMNKLEAFAGNIQFWKIFPTFTWNRFVKASDVFAEISFKHIKKSLDELDKNSRTDEPKRITMLQNLFLEGMTISDAMVTVSDMLMAGIETTSHAVAFLLYHLARNSEKQATAFHEISNLLPTDDIKISEKTWNELKYLKACLKESMRLIPVVGGTARVMEKDVIIGGYRVPAGTLVAVGYQEMCNNEKYHKFPHVYLPERWLDRSKKSHPFALLPFGAGARSCIGRRIAELEIICLTAEIMRNFRIEYRYEPIGMFTKLVSVPDKPLRFNFRSR